MQFTARTAPRDMLKHPRQHLPQGEAARDVDPDPSDALFYARPGLAVQSQDEFARDRDQLLALLSAQGARFKQAHDMIKEVE